MRKKSFPEEHGDDLRPEYGPDFFQNLKPNRFAGVTFAPPTYFDEEIPYSAPPSGRCAQRHRTTRRNRRK